MYLSVASRPRLSPSLRLLRLFDRLHVARGRVDLPENVATSKLGRLRELMLREARLLESLHHDCIVPLECGWLEQRIREISTTSLCDVTRASLSSTDNWCRDDATEFTPWKMRDNQQSERSRQWQSESPGVTSGGLDQAERQQPRALSNNHVYPICENPIELLLAHVPWTVDEHDHDTRHDKHFGESNQLRGRGEIHWGGDHSTGWMGSAEPKTPTNIARLTTPGRHRYMSNNSRGFFRQKWMYLACYMLMPDGLQLSKWFETEFEPRISFGKDDTTGAITTARDWSRVWRQLVHLFLQIVQGVEYIHLQGMVHNSLNPKTVWVSEYFGKH